MSAMEPMTASAVVKSLKGWKNRDAELARLQRPVLQPMIDKIRQIMRRKSK